MNVTTGVMTRGSPCADGLHAFLQAFSLAPDILVAALGKAGLAARMHWLTDGQLLCEKGDAADCYWVICDGQIRVEEDNILVVARIAGEMVGEQAFFRVLPDGSTPRRGNTLRAYGDTKVLTIDRALVNALTGDERAAWNETVARVLTKKLDEATVRRVDLHIARLTYQSLVSRFVCKEGQAAALAALDSAGAPNAITAEVCDAVMWFSDIAGFSSFASKLPPKEAAAIVREIMDIQAQEIAAAGGHIDKFMGDGLMAFWRAPDEARLAASCCSAVRAADNTAKRLLAYFKNKILPLDIRIGLHAGSVILGDFGGGDRIAFTAIGDTVNAAARYEQASKRADSSALGRVRASPDLFSRVTDLSLRSEFEEGVAVFKDKHERIFEVHVTKY